MAAHSQQLFLENSISIHLKLPTKDDPFRGGAQGLPNLFSCCLIRLIGSNHKLKQHVNFAAAQNKFYRCRTAYRVGYRVTNEKNQAAS